MAGDNQPSQLDPREENSPSSWLLAHFCRLLRQSAALCTDRAGKSRLALDFLCLFEISPAEGTHRTKAFQMQALKRKDSISAAGF